MRALVIWFAALAAFAALATYAVLEMKKHENRGPRYTLEAFKRQWRINAPSPKAHFNTLHTTEDGPTAYYGDGVSLLIVMSRELVTGVRVRYDTQPDPEGAGGPRFLALVHTAINVGTHRWPQERIDHVRRAFGLNLQSKSYRYFHTTFTRKYEPPDKWEFAMDYVADRPAENTEGPSPPPVTPGRRNSEDPSPAQDPLPAQETPEP